MDRHHFDDLIAAFAHLSRRGVSKGLAALVAAPGLTWLVSTGAEAKRRRKRRKKKRCKGGTIKCGGRCCAPDSCIDGDCCPADRLCGAICCAVDQVCGDPETELCVVGQGTCPAGANSCDGGFVACNGGKDCGCLRSTAGATRCGQLTVDSECGQCASDAACQAILGVPGAFCVTDFSSPCSCAAGETICAIPCPG